MKLALALLALVVVVSAKFELPNFGHGELKNDIQDFLDVLPQDEIMSITLQYVSEDKEFQGMLKYMQSKDFKKLVKEVEALKEVKSLMNYIHEAGIDIYKMVNVFNDYIGLDHLTPPDSKLIYAQKITGGIRGFIDDILAVLPRKKLDKMYEDKLKESKAFAKFIKQLESENFQKIVDKVYKHSTFQDLLKHAEKVGIDLLAIKDLLKVLWGITIPPRPRFFINY